VRKVSYNHILEHGINFLNDSEFDVELENIMIKEV